MIVTVFGASKPMPGEITYEDARRLGESLARAGHSVMTGGYIGTMEAVSRGAAECGGHVIGATCEQIEAWRTVVPNKWIVEERRFATLSERLSALIEGADALIALPGGIGTLAEIAMLWNQLVIQATSPRPLVLLGSGWEQVINTLYLEMGDFIPENDRRWLSFASSIDDAVEQVNRFQSSKS
jgi:uncharacterized protein (TIGR00730 family)